MAVDSDIQEEKWWAEDWLSKLEKDSIQRMLTESFNDKMALACLQVGRTTNCLLEEDDTPPMDETGTGRM